MVSHICRDKQRRRNLAHLLVNAGQLHQIQAWLIVFLLVVYLNALCPISPLAIMSYVHSTAFCVPQHVIIYS